MKSLGLSIRLGFPNPSGHVRILLQMISTLGSPSARTVCTGDSGSQQIKNIFIQILSPERIRARFLYLLQDPLSLSLPLAKGQLRLRSSSFFLHIKPFAASQGVIIMNLEAYAMVALNI